MKVTILLAALFLFVLACGDDDSISQTTGLSDDGLSDPKTTNQPGDNRSVPQTVRQTEDSTSVSQPTSQSSKDCSKVGTAFEATPSDESQNKGSGVLEQRVLDKELVVRAELLNVERKAVEKSSLKFELEGDSDIYENYTFLLIYEVSLRVYEYLKGEGPDNVTAVVEGQLAFNSIEEIDCATRVFSLGFDQLLDSGGGIAFLNHTDDPNLYHMGLAYNDFQANNGQHSNWLPAEDDNFYNGSVDGWIGWADVRRRVSDVIEEFNRSDEDSWRECVFKKYFDKSTDPDPWRYRGVAIPYHAYRDHEFIFDGEPVPVPAGALLWISPDTYRDESGLKVKLEMRLDGEHADLFEVAYHSEYEYIANEWLGTSGGMDHHLAIWYKPREGRVEQWPSTTAAYVITVAKELDEGVYRFNLHTRLDAEGIVDCGQARFEPRNFKVIVDKERVTTPPAPTNVEVVSMDSEGWTVGWDTVDGVDVYWVKVYRVDGNDEEMDGRLENKTEGLTHRIRFADMKGCGDVIYVEIWPHGDGKTYLNDYGEPSEPIKIEAEPCEQI